MAIVSDSNAFELHPVSGEIDFGDVGNVNYRRLDEETLQARVTLTDLGLDIVYLWCEGDQEGGGNGWRVSEVRPLEENGEKSPSNWWATIDEADEKATDKMMDDAIRQGENHSITLAARDENSATDDEKADNDGDYWAQYDNTPGRTPAAKLSPAPLSSLNRHVRTTTEAEYFAQYAQVQPEMDNDDPSEYHEATGESTLNGDVLASSMGQTSELASVGRPNTDALPNGAGTETAANSIRQPIAGSPNGLDTVLRLEDTAGSQAVAEVAVKQHVSTSIRSLFRLCRSCDIERCDFDQMVRTELDTLKRISEGD